MNTKWKISIGIVVLLAVFVFISSVFLFTGTMSNESISSAPESKPKSLNNESMSSAPKPMPKSKLRSKPKSKSKSKSLNNVDSLLDKMEFGAIAFNSPASINIADSHQIQLFLSLAESVEHLKIQVTDGGLKSGATIKVSDRMEARLTGYMFQITAITPEVQAVSKNERTEWKWEIHPKKEGKHKLHLTLTALLEIDGRSTPRVIRTFDKVIDVEITASQSIKHFFSNNWQWLWAAILVPVAGWLWKRKRLINTSS